MPIYIYKGNSQISTNAVRNDKAVKAIYAKEQREEAVCVWGTNLNILPFTYTKNETSITITGLKSGVMMKHLRVPETIEDLPVTQITYDTFKNNTVLESIRLPNSLNGIGNSAFYGCKGLTSITIPDGVTSIGGSAFRGCTGLTSVTIGSGLKFMDSYMFYGCANIQDICITDIVAWCDINGLEGLMEYGSRNKNLYINNELATSITIPNGVTKIGGSAFRGCTGLTSMTIPDSVTSIGVRVFYNCIGITSVTFNGTKAQWNAISKGNQWNYNTGNYTIHCTDGDIPKS